MLNRAQFNSNRPVLVVALATCQLKLITIAITNRENTVIRLERNA